MPPTIQMTAIVTGFVVERSWKPNEVKTPVPIILAMTKVDAVLTPILYFLNSKIEDIKRLVIIC